MVHFSHQPPILIEEFRGSPQNLQEITLTMSATQLQPRPFFATFPNYFSLTVLLYCDMIGERGITVIKVLCYISEGRWFDPSWYH